MERITLSRKEIKRIGTLDALNQKKIKQGEAAGRMGISIRQVQRLIKRYSIDQGSGLAHKLRGKPSNKAYSQEFKDNIVQILQDFYHDFGPTLASEMLDERHNIVIGKEVLRRIMLEAGIWQKRKKRSKHRSWRKPRDRRGELVQLDVSLHEWFEERGGWISLVKFIDDATKEILYAKFIHSESYNDVTQATIEYFQLHGLPQSLYTDKGKVFKVNIHNEDNEFLTQYEYSLQLLGVELIHAHSPQAKGRVERGFGTDQDRLVKMLRIEQISTMEAANKYLHEKYIPKLNSKFTRPAALIGDLHVPLNEVDLYDIFCIRETRKVHNDWTIRYDNRIFQITKDQKVVVRPKDEVLTHKRLDGSINLQLRGANLNFIEIAALPEKIKEPNPVNRRKINTPWRRTNSMFFEPKTRHSYCAKQHDISIVS